MQTFLEKHPDFKLSKLEILFCGGRGPNIDLQDKTTHRRWPPREVRLGKRHRARPSSSRKHPGATCIRLAICLKWLAFFLPFKVFQWKNTEKYKCEKILGSW
ncbi:hypothetical protein JG688_00001882 [Phytophthora aleatoria]|uniref:Uncharacterized protein n=1 Tax=Phytophthora aleatoria TaxID=2496075 RepID=A0A8J5IVD9_9STRA|nr:hypothetical protein JG688_00001882 [Phytophthora aleatoria]